MPALNLFQNDKFYLDAYEAPFAFYSNFEMNNFDFDKIEAYNISSLALELAGVEYGPMEKFRVYLSDDKDYESYEALLEYDMLFGSFEAYDDQETRRISREQRRIEGEESILVQLSCKKLQKNISIPEIADMLEEDEETIQKICDAASKHAPEYDIDKIIKDLIQ